MAIFKTGALIGGISGNVGGANFVNARGSGVVRKTRLSTPGCTEAQLLKQARLQRSILRWVALSDDKKKQWNTAALTISFTNRLGVKRLLSGYQYFLRANGLQDTDDPPQPAFDFPGFIINFSSSASMGILVENIGDTSASIYTGLIEAMPLFKDNPPQFVNFYRSLGLINMVTLPRVDITSNYGAVFSPPVLNQWVAFKWTSYVNNTLTQQIFPQVVQTTA